MVYLVKIVVKDYNNLFSWTFERNHIYCNFNQFCLLASERVTKNSNFNTIRFDNTVYQSSVS